ncbi:MAG TPA: hypothetical protein VN690_00105 [Terriglobales bacterium]|nr:hypothetical protein [Terriglobales bacterium]
MARDSAPVNARLFQFFFRSFFISDVLAPGGDPRTLGITAAAFFAAPGIAICLYMTIFGSRLNTNPEAAFFLALSMTLAPLLALVFWDELLPTRLDYLVLRPLPLSWPGIAAAKLLAWIVLLGLFLLVVNAFSCVMLPLVNSSDQVAGAAVLRRIAAQALGVGGGAVWAFLWVLALRGTLAFFGEARRVAMALRLALTAALLAAIVVSPELTEPSIYRHLAAHPPPWALPLFWFLGVTHALTGRAAATWNPLAFAAGRQLTYAAVAAALAYGAACWRLPRQALAPLAPPLRGPWPSAWASRQPRRAAVYRFALATLARSRRHSLLLAAWLGLAAAAVLSSLASLSWAFPAPTIEQADAVALAAPLALCFLIAIGIRHTIAIPTEARAHWLFQLAETEPAPERLLAFRDVLLALAVLPALASGVLLALRIWGGRIAALHLLFSGTLMLLLAEALVCRVRKLPFTCPYVPGRANLKFWWPAYWLAFSAFSFGAAALERSWWAHPLRIVGFSILALAATAALRGWNRHWRASLDACQFDDAPDPAVQQLFQ